MVFDYYHRLGSKQKAIYRNSDGIEHINLNHPENIRHAVLILETALAAEDRNRTEHSTRMLVNGITSDLNIIPAGIKVLNARPSRNWGELHGLYEPVQGGSEARITVWMRTAKHKKVVAFRTFLRTVLHELCHHLDYEFYRLADSYHTEGFFKRESSLFRQLVQNKQ